MSETKVTASKHGTPPASVDLEAEKQALLDTIKNLSTQIDSLKSQIPKPEILDTPIPGVATESSASTKVRYRIVVEPSTEEGAPTTVTPSVNGRMYAIKRGEPVDVPPEVLHVLDNAVQGTLVKSQDDRGNSLGYEVRDSRRFPYQVLGQSRDADGNSLPVPEYGRTRW